MREPQRAEQMRKQLIDLANRFQEETSRMSQQERLALMQRLTDETEIAWGVLPGPGFQLHLIKGRKRLEARVASGQTVTARMLAIPFSKLEEAVAAERTWGDGKLTQPSEPSRRSRVSEPFLGRLLTFVSNRHGKFYVALMAAPEESDSDPHMGIAGPFATDEEAEEQADKWTKLNEKRTKEGKSAILPGMDGIPDDVRGYITEGIRKAVRERGWSTC